MSWAASWAVSSATSSAARRQVARRARREHYPAPYAILDAWSKFDGDPFRIPEQHPAGIGALLSIPGQDPAKSNVVLTAPHGTVDAGAAGIRVAGNLNIVALQILNAFNIQLTGGAEGDFAQFRYRLDGVDPSSCSDGTTWLSRPQAWARSASSSPV